MSPRISVLLPVYNGQKYLSPAIESVLAQTFIDFEVIAIDDGSADNSAPILAAYAARDSRLRVYRQTNLGLPATLNRALALARGEYVARMDADDLCLPQRLARQVAFLDAHPHIGVCGSWVEAFGDAGSHVWRYPLTDAAIRCALMFSPPLAHPAVMLRRDLLLAVGGYSVDFPVVEDYELWLRLAKMTVFANLPEVLLRYRLHGAQKGSRENRLGIMAAAMEILHRAQLSQMGMSPTPEAYAIHQALSTNRPGLSRQSLIQEEGWLRTLLAANQTTRYLPEPAFAQTIGDRWRADCFLARTWGWWGWELYWRSPLRQVASATWASEVRFGASSAWHVLRRLTHMADTSRQ